MAKPHSFHIPVMGTGFTIDSALRVAQYGIDSVIAIADHTLLEKLRKMYSEKTGRHFEPLSDKNPDFRASAITAYLNLIFDMATEKFDELKNAGMDSFDEIRKYFSMLPDWSTLKLEFVKRSAEYPNLADLKAWISSHITMGDIDVNIMTKVDKPNFHHKQPLDTTYNDAHAALRGFALSKLNGSVVFSAGMNPRLYSYAEHFDDFYPNDSGQFKKRIIIKVSDYRSALIQGKFLAKKGLWVSEYRIESGLNCGGHAFATDGYLMGPILAMFRDNRSEMQQTIEPIWRQALKEKGKIVPEKSPTMRITAQGGVGTAEEHRFLLDEYGVDSVGWGSPFLLVPEVTNVDEFTLNQLVDAKEEDLYLSNISPLGVPFNNLRNNTKDLEKQRLIDKGRPGSSCPKKYLALNDSFEKSGLCTASRQYQHLKLKEMAADNALGDQAVELFEQVVEKSCICVGLGTSALLVNGLSTKTEGEGVSICPGPNLAYFSKTMTLSEMVDHIYGRANHIDRKDRPHVFIKELSLYLDYAQNKLSSLAKPLNDKDKKYWNGFIDNLNQGIQYYQNLFNGFQNAFALTKQSILDDLKASQVQLRELQVVVGSN